jgi:hypothetical protein
MFSRLLKHKAGMGAVLVTSLLLVGSLVAPALGAPSPLSVAKKALKTAKKANRTAKKANSRSKRALSRANSANGAAKSAGATAAGASTAAGAASTKAGQALGIAQSAAGHSGPAAIAVSDAAPVPSDNTSVETEAFCPDGFVPIGGGVSVLDSSDEVVTTGIAMTESAIDVFGLGWYGAVQDTDNASGRTMQVTVQCSKPSSIAGASNVRRR